MEVIYSLIPGMIFFGLLMVGVLIWAVKRGQYEDLEGDAHRILMDEDDTPAGKGDKRDAKSARHWPDAEDDQL